MIEQDLRSAWASFVAKANEAQEAGYIVSLPNSLKSALGISATARVAPPSPDPGPAPTLSQEPQSDPGDEDPAPQPKRRRSFSHE